jgi:Uma2 family endonuclease
METTSTGSAAILGSNAVTARPKGIVIGGRVRVPASALTLNGFRRWVHSRRFPRHRRASFANGEVFLEMSPEDFRSHNSPKRDIAGFLWTFLREHPIGQLIVDGMLFVNEAADVSTEPDISFCLWESFEQGRVQLCELKKGSQRYVELHGSPDLVIEIISNSSVDKDSVTLRDAYHRAGIHEYWIVDARGPSLAFEVLHRQPHGYVSATSDEQGLRHSNVLARGVALWRHADRIGGWQYTLQIV